MRKKNRRRHDGKLQIIKWFSMNNTSTSHNCEEFACFRFKVKSVCLTVSRDLIFPLKVVKCAERLEVRWLVCAKCEVKCLVCRLSSSGEPQLILEVMLACSGRVPGLITRSEPCALRSWTRHQFLWFTARRVLSHWSLGWVCYCLDRGRPK